MKRYDLTIAAAAAQLGVSQMTVRRLVKSGEIAYRRLPGSHSHLRFNTDDIEEASQRFVVPARASQRPQPKARQASAIGVLPMPKIRRFGV